MVVVLTRSSASARRDRAGITRRAAGFPGARERVRTCTHMLDFAGTPARLVPCMHCTRTVPTASCTYCSLVCSLEACSSRASVKGGYGWLMHLLEDSQGSLQPGAVHDTRQVRMDLRVDGLRLTRSEHADRACQDSRACGTACFWTRACRQLNCRLGPLLQRDLVGACAGASQRLPELGYARRSGSIGTAVCQAAQLGQACCGCLSARGLRAGGSSKQGR